MKKLKIMLSILVLLVAIVIMGEVEAASITTSPSSISIAEGETTTFTIKANNATGNIVIKSSDSSIASVSPSSSWIENNSITVTVIAKRAGTATISAYSTKTEGVSSVANSEDGSSVDVKASCSITVKTKTVVPPAPKPEPEPTPNPGGSTGGTTSGGTTTKPSGNTSKKETTTKKEEKELPEEKEEKEEATPPFGLSSLIITAVKGNEEKEEITLTPNFQMDCYEYTCNVSTEITKIEIAKDAGIYNEYITIEQEESLKPGENIIKIKMAKEGQEEVCYTIKVIKEEAEETVALLEENTMSKEEFKITMPIIPFMIMQLGIIVIEVITIKYIPWRRIFKRK